MARMCQITGKKPVSGNSRSHSNIASKRRFGINLQKKRLLNPATGSYMTVRLTTKALKTLRKWDEEGKVYDLRKLIDGNC